MILLNSKFCYLYRPFSLPQLQSNQRPVQLWVDLVFAGCVRAVNGSPAILFHTAKAVKSGFAMLVFQNVAGYRLDLHDDPSSKTMPAPSFS